MGAKSSQSCPGLYDLWTVAARFSVLGILQAGILEWVVMFSTESLKSKDHGCVSCLMRWLFTTSPNWEAQSMSVVSSLRPMWLTHCDDQV